MGCGTSNVSGERQLEKKSSKRDRDEHARKLMKVESKLGSKKIVNSFVVATAKAKARKRDTYNVDHQDPAFAKASADGLFWPSDSLGIVKETFALPAENANVAEPDLLGVTTSGPSFKMARGGSSSTKKRQHMTDEELEAAEAQKEVDRFKENLYKDDEDSIMEAATYFRERLSVTNAPVSEIRMMGVVPRLIALLSRKSARIQHEAAWAITNICSADHQDCQDVVDQGAVPALVNVLSTSKDSDVLQQVIWALGNIAADSRDMQQAIFDDGVLDPVLQCMQGRHTIHAPHAPHAPSTSSPGQQPDSNDEEPVDNQTAVTRQAAWLLSNMCRPRPPDNSVYRALSVFETLLGAIKDSEALTHLCWTLAYISNSEEGLEKLASNQFILKQLLQWLSNPNTAMCVPSLRAIGNVCSGSAACTQAVADAEGIKAIMTCMKSSELASVQKECIWSLSNLAVGSSKLVQKMADLRVFEDVIGVLHQSNGDEGIIRESAYVLANPWSTPMGTDATKALMDQGVVKEMIELLALDTPEKVLKVVMDGLKDAVKKGMVLQITAKEGAVNPVVSLMRQMDAHGRLEGLSSASSDVGVRSMANTLLNALTLDE